MSYVILDLQARIHLDRLCQLGARPRIISTLMPHLPNKIIRAHWTAAQGKTPSQGGATTRASSYWATLKTRYHSSFGLCTYLLVEKSQIHFIDAYTRAYDEYQTFFAREKAENFDWFFGLVRNFLDGNIELVCCQTCQVQYVHNPDDLVNDRNCPAHKYLEPDDTKRKSLLPASKVKALEIVYDCSQAVLPFMLEGVDDRVVP